MAETSSGVAPDEPSAKEAKGASPAPRKNKKAYAIGAGTLAFALGGALAGAAAFSAASGGASRPGAGDRLTTSASQMPSVTGSLCSSYKNTATAADTAIACRDYGMSSYRALVAAARGELSPVTAPAKRAVGTGTAKSTRPNKVSSALGEGEKTVTSKVTKKAAKLPVSAKKHNGGACVSVPHLPKGVPTTLPSANLNVSLGNSGQVSVSTGSKGTSVCAGKTHKNKKHKKKAAGTSTTTTTTTTNPVQSVVSGVSGIAGGTPGL
jgi:hypothetical protein